ANPALDGLDAMIESKDSAIALARKKGKPDFTVGVSYTDMKDVRNEPRLGAFLDAMDAVPRLIQPKFVQTPLLPQGATLLDRALAFSEFGNGLREDAIQGMMDVNSLVELENAFDNQKMKDEVMVSVEMNVPIWRRKVKAGIEEAEHMKSAAQHDKRRTLVELEGAAKMAIFGIEDGYRRLKLYDEKLLPQVKQTYETLEGAYAAGNAEAGFLDVLMTVQTKLEFEEERAEAVRDIHAASADLELILGGPWSANGPATAPAAPTPGPSPEPSPEADSAHEK
ncbi:MAG: TolC family protein, partial [Candidatus Hydrogenedentes bacterium]|nr:TolC family protein [Candidatus Hydrogenedentota bacterium]